MTIAPGTRFGTFEILSPLGSGGMGEVYRARDTRLHRNVALKLLPKDFAHDAERVARLTREARLLASLSHPNIAAIHGIEEHGGEIALVLELVEGPTLADQLASGPLPAQRALAVAQQVAEAIEAAHARGVIHRDLKPSNLKVTSDGQVKVLDFGIAKALADDSTSQTTSLAGTRVGVVIGTPGYMSPEQTAGGPVDRRTDVWAFGCVLFETLVGRRAFGGDTVGERLAGVLNGEPDWDALPPSTPDALKQLLVRCLRKDARQRLQDVGDARIAIEELRMAQESPTDGVRSREPSTRRWVGGWTFGVAMGLAAAALFVWGLGRGDVPPPVPAHLIVQLPPDVILPLDPEHPVLALSPDGTRLAFVGDERGIRRIYVRDLADPVARPLAGTEGAADPFFSPDGAWITFFNGNMIKRIAPGGGASLAVHAATEVTVNRGATWVTSDTLIYSASANSGLSRGSASGQQARAYDDWAYVTTEINAPYAWPFALPGGAKVVFTDVVGDSPDQSRVSVLTLADKRVTTLINGGTSARYSAGHLLFARAGSLYAVPFDAKGAQPTGPERKLLDGVIVEPNGAVQYAVSATGVLAYVAGAPVARQHELVWVDRTGTGVTLRDDGREYSFPRLSPDGTQLAVTSPTGSNYDVWILDLQRGSLRPVTRATGEDFEPVWNPDGTRLAISSEREDEEGPGLAWTNGADYRLEFPLRSPGVGNWEFPTSWSPDGKWLAFTRDRAGAPSSDVEMLPISGAATPVPFAAEPASEAGAMFSPKGPYVAYVSDVSGREEVYVRPFPGQGAAMPISTDGGIEPVWSRDGRELFYREGDALKSVKISISAQGALARGIPITVFEGRYDRAPYGGRSANYDISPDGQRFLMVRRKNLPQPTTIHVVLNWPDALLRRATLTER